MEIFNTLENSQNYVNSVVKDTFRTKTNGLYEINYTTTEGLYLYSLNKSVAQGFYTFYEMINKKFIPQIFPSTANEFYLENGWGETFKKYKQNSAISSGYIIFQGTEGAVIPANSSFLKDSNTYTSEELVTNTLVDIPYISLTELNGVITVTLDQDYKLATNMMMEEIAGGYLATDKAITVLSSNSFSFLKTTGVEITAQTGIATFILALVKVNSAEGGANKDAEDGEEISLLNSINGVNDIGYITYDGLTGGMEEETLADYRLRIENIFQNSGAGWAESNIYTVIREYKRIFSNAYIYIPRAQNEDGESKGGYTTAYMLKKKFNPQSSRFILADLSLTEQEDLKLFLTGNEYGIYSIKDSYGTFNLATVVRQEINIDITLTNGYKTLDMIEAIENSFYDDFQFNENYCYFAKDILKEDVVEFIKNIYDKNGTALKNNFTLDMVDTIDLLYNEFPIIKVNIL